MSVTELTSDQVNSPDTGKQQDINFTHHPCQLSHQIELFSHLDASRSFITASRSICHVSGSISTHSVIQKHLIFVPVCFYCILFPFLQLFSSISYCILYLLCPLPAGCKSLYIKQACIAKQCAHTHPSIVIVQHSFLYHLIYVCDSCKGQDWRKSAST